MAALVAFTASTASQRRQCRSARGPSPLANQVVGSISADLSNGAAATGEMQAGDLIADA